MQSWCRLVKFFEHDFFYKIELCKFESLVVLVLVCAMVVQSVNVGVGGCCWWVNA